MEEESQLTREMMVRREIGVVDKDSEGNKSGRRNKRMDVQKESDGMVGLGVKLSKIFCK